MIIKALLSDFSIKSEIWSDYIRINEIKLSEYDHKSFQAYLAEKGLLNLIESYNICYINNIDSCIQKKTILNQFAQNANIFFKTEFEMELLPESLYCAFFSLLTRPDAFQTKEQEIEIPLEYIHKNLTFIDKTNGHIFNDTRELLKKMNERYGNLILTKEDKDYYLSYLKAA